MPSAGHIRQRSPGSFELRYAFGTNPATGKQRTVTATVKGNRVGDHHNVAIGFTTNGGLENEGPYPRAPARSLGDRH
jgi:hypothetical protein